MTRKLALSSRRGLRGATARIVSTLAAVAAPACVSRDLPEDLRGAAWCSSWGAPDADVRRIVEACETARSAARGGSLDVLVLSGGGADGAFGAGVLTGWRASESLPRPDFDLVTGVSTGALLATYAFLGDPEYDDDLRRSYTEVSNHDIYRERFFPFVESSMVSTGPLQDLVRDRITDGMIRAVAEKGRSGKRLLAGTVDIDRGCFVAWDLTRIATEGDTRRYRSILLASAAIPVFFPPVEIDGHLHVDGGVREQLFLRALTESLTEDAADPVRLFVVVNGKLGVRPVGVDETLADLALRSVDVLLDEGKVASLRRIHEMASARGAEFRFLAIPRKYVHQGDPDTHVFDPVKMKGLFDEGFRLAKSALWETGPPHE